MIVMHCVNMTHESGWKPQQKHGSPIFPNPSNLRIWVVTYVGVSHLIRFRSVVNGRREGGHWSCFSNEPLGWRNPSWNGEQHELKWGEALTRQAPWTQRGLRTKTFCCIYLCNPVCKSHVFISKLPKECDGAVHTGYVRLYSKPRMVIS